MLFTSFPNNYFKLGSLERPKLLLFLWPIAIKELLTSLMPLEFNFFNFATETPFKEISKNPSVDYSDLMFKSCPDSMIKSCPDFVIESSPTDSAANLDPDRCLACLSEIPALESLFPHREAFFSTNIHSPNSRPFSLLTEFEFSYLCCPPEQSPSRSLDRHEVCLSCSLVPWGFGLTQPNYTSPLRDHTFH